MTVEECSNGGRKALIEQLEQRIAVYRRYLSEGVDVALAVIYLHDLAGAEAALATLLDDDAGSC
ncbi:MAG: hypothetical protein JO001_04210 [Alphaproteobacteria bacterium]|nr:hypothetical protein [Alphaproteobacteria bacterium]